MGTPHVLTSWKQIAQFIDVSVRTAQRYAIHSRLPVHSLTDCKRSAVMATAQDLENWIKANPTFTKNRATQQSNLPLLENIRTMQRLTRELELRALELQKARSELFETLVRLHPSL